MDNLTRIIEQIKQLSVEDRNRVQQALDEMAWTDPDDDWALQGDQLAFMVTHHDVIMAAYATDDLGGLDRISESAEYRDLFGGMCWDEAFDRYEETWMGDA